MSNQLAMDKSLAIQSLAEQGYSERRIAEMLGISRKAIRRHKGLGRAKETKAPIGEAPLGSDVPKETKAPLGTEEGLRGEKVRSRSLCEAYHSVIIEKLELGLTAQRIFQDLQVEHGFPGQYFSVRRYVAKLGKKAELPFRRIETEPGQELQVDYGIGAPCLNAEGKLVRTYVFRLVLSHSRKGYCEAVRRLTTESFIRSMENAFRALGGVPQTVVFDNAKAVVTHADWFDPLLNPKIIAFCKHYGFALLPTKPRTPRHKGKIERGIGYVKSNALRGRKFASLHEQNEFLQEWERKVADTRIHGTIKRHVGEFFEKVERPALQPVRSELFPIYNEQKRRVSRDGHIAVARAFYSVPPEYLGREVWVRWNDQTVKVLNQRMEQIAIHCRKSDGSFSTLQEHLASEKINSIERGAKYLLDQVKIIGDPATRWAELSLETMGVAGMRSIQGLLSLARQFESKAINAACEIAIKHKAYRYRAVKQLLYRDAQVQKTFEFIDVHPVIRPLSEYAQFIHDAIQHEG